MTIEQEIAMFEETVCRMTKLFAGKRTDYGQTTTETFKKFGPLSLYVRMCDKMGRLENLMVNGGVDHVGEKMEDTLIDLANYCIITLIELRKENMCRTEGISEQNIYCKRN